MENSEKILRLHEVIARCGLCRSTIYQRISAGLFPTAISLGPRSIGFLDSEVTAWIAKRVEISRRPKGEGASAAARGSRES